MRALALATVLLAGCATLGRTTSGSMPSPAAIAAVPEGAALTEVLDRLGAPLEYFHTPDGMLLVWRAQRYDFDRLEFDPSQGLSFVSLEPTLGAALANLRMTLERGTLRQDRVAVLFDRSGRVVAVAHRDGEGRRLR